MAEVAIGVDPGGDGWVKSSLVSGPPNVDPTGLVRMLALIEHTVPEITKAMRPTAHPAG